MFPPPDTTLEISPADTAAWLAENPLSFALIDCREEDEWNICRLDGARLIPLSQFAELAPLQLDPATPIVLYCHHGMRSAQAATWLRKKGFRAWSLAGGIDAWAEEIDPELRRY
jgi:rhodanese-related sulfurtransferase